MHPQPHLVDAFAGWASAPARLHRRVVNRGAPGLGIAEGSRGREADVVGAAPSTSSHVQFYLEIGLRAQLNRALF
eukprot:scaffold52888_cov70-Phaeocystis_antarctica.AAC.14